MQILARLPRISYLAAKSVSRSWKSAILSPELYEVRKELKTTEEWLYILTTDENEMLTWHAFDPVSKRWQRLPPMPNIGVEESRYNLRTISNNVSNWFDEEDLINQMPFCGCAVGSADGSIYIIGEFYKAATMNCVFRYDPIFNKWNELNPLSIPRAYAKIGVVNGKMYKVGGLTKSPGDLHPLQSAERFDHFTAIWSKIPSMQISKGQNLLSPFMVDFFETTAAGICMYKGKLFVPQSWFCGPAFFDAGGGVYDPETNLWTEMPRGMRDVRGNILVIQAEKESDSRLVASTSSSPSGGSSNSGVDSAVWKAIASRSAGLGVLGNCLTLDI